MQDPITQGPGPEARYRSFLAEGRFMIQRSVTTGDHVFYSRTMMPGSGGTDLEWVEASGRATVYSCSIVRRPDAEGGDDSIAIVELAEGPRTMTRIVGCRPEEVVIGMEVRARIDSQEGEPIVFFEPARNGETS
ncbi:Zn-ribbon domain-containing OB-fold protein [Hoeflea olei]|uniref:ChsH2 C-terminal OB-fold domain-containing protein n=1 Tax=Hoeflea olei TaxID=1480615 RepID=A0A1C1YYI8_9HYPH|nr:OB-fold domain-containing protein [Hoeflea olei]OCW58545.1 hypothetical protein AWJ14_18730 [Hoeflea olei]